MNKLTLKKEGKNLIVTFGINHIPNSMIKDTTIVRRSIPMFHPYVVSSLEWTTTHRDEILLHDRQKSNASRFVKKVDLLEFLES